MWYITLTCKQDRNFLGFEIFQRYSGQMIEPDHPDWNGSFTGFNAYLGLTDETTAFLRHNRSVFFIPLLSGSELTLLMVQRNRLQSGGGFPATLSFFHPSLSNSLDLLRMILGADQVKNAIGRVNVRYYSDIGDLMDDLDIRGELTNFWFELWRRIKSESFVNIGLTLISTLLTLVVVIRLGLSLIIPLSALDGLALLAPFISTGVLLGYYILSSLITVNRCHSLRFLFTAGKRMFFNLEKWEQ